MTVTLVRIFADVSVTDTVVAVPFRSVYLIAYLLAYLGGLPRLKA